MDCHQASTSVCPQYLSAGPSRPTAVPPSPNPEQCTFVLQAAEGEAWGSGVVHGLPWFGCVTLWLARWLHNTQLHPAMSLRLPALPHQQAVNPIDIACVSADFPCRPPVSLLPPTQDVWGEGAREKDKLPLLLGEKHCIVVMLGETVRAALAARAGADSLTLKVRRG